MDGCVSGCVGEWWNNSESNIMCRKYVCLFYVSLSPPHAHVRTKARWRAALPLTPSICPTSPLQMRLSERSTKHDGCT